MKKIKMAIISSYSESCGNAFFSKILHDSIEFFYKNIEVEVIELNLNLLQSIDSKTRALGNKHIDEICKRLIGFDFVNIQMEAGLYGTIPKDIANRFSKIIRVTEFTSVTFHSPRLIMGSSQIRGGIKSILHLNFKLGFKYIFNEFYKNIHINLNKKLISLASSKAAFIIVHTKKSQKCIENIWNFHAIKTHPLKMVPQDYVYNPKTFQDITLQADLEEGDVTIGIFGFISQYKGHADALLAMMRLPKNYKLLIVGRQHPQTLNDSGFVDVFLKSLIDLINSDESLKKKVKFLGEFPDNEFYDLISDIDVCWLPYYENGQDGSGIASICFDLANRIVCSSSFVFDELFKLESYTNFMRFDVGNYIELSQKTEMIMKRPLQKKSNEAQNNFTLKSQAKIYVEDFLK